MASNDQDSGSGSGSKIYTKTGDEGKTSLIGGTRVSKAHLRLEAYGSVDELNSLIGVLMSETDFDLGTRGQTEEARRLHAFHSSIQRELFNVGSQLACEDPDVRRRLPGVEASDVVLLEQAIDDYTKLLKPLRNFVLPSGSRAASLAHLARTVCRRTERHCVALHENATDGHVDPLIIRYLNRLSDYFFALARHLNRLAGVEEPLWSAKTAKAEKES